jgi:capsular polysaccharide biosynthesis protein
MNKQKLIKVFWVILTIAATAVLVFVIDQIREPMYKSQAKYMTIVEPSQEDTNINYNQKALANHQAILTAELVDTRSFVKSVFQQSNIIYKSDLIDEYQKLIEAEVVGDTEVVDFTVRYNNPQRALTIAEAALDKLKEEVNSESWPGEGVTIEIIDQPSLPSSPYSPNYFVDLIIGLSAVFLGVVIYKIML